MDTLFTKKFFIWVSIVLLAGNIAWAAEYFSLKKDFKDLQNTADTATLNAGILSFTQLFINKVIMSETEVDFDTRLALENSVRNIKDEQVLSAWKAFIDSKTELEAQNRVKELLGILVGKIRM